jgi:hypothetical protein
MTTPSDNAPLSIDQAVSALISVDEPQVSDDAAPEEVAADVNDDAVEPDDEAPAEESEGDPAPDEADDPDDDPTIEGEEDEEPESDPELPVIAAPKSWDAVGRAEFAKLPRTTQEIILARETERDKAVGRAQNEAQETRKQAQAELEGVVAFKDKLDQAVTRAQSAFAGKWDGMSPEAWLAFSREDPQAYTIAKAEYDADMSELASAERARAETGRLAEAAQQRELQNYPDLVDPKEGTARRAKVGSFLLSHGVTHDQLAGISAVEVAIAYDAMRFREGQAALKSARTANPATAPNPAPKAVPTKTAKPSAAAPVRPSPQRSVEQARARLDKSGSVEDAVALLLAKDQK